VDVGIELENGLVQAKYWLPTSQRVEIRRRTKYMELPFGSTIRASFRVLEYDLDPPPGPPMKRGHHVQSRPEEELRRYAGWHTEELLAWPSDVSTDSMRMDEIRSEATSIAKGRYLGGDAPLRLYVPNVSSAFRVRRAEGVYAGAGVRWQIDGFHAAVFNGGWAFGRKTGALRGGLERSLWGGTLRAEGWVNELTDVSPLPAASGIVSTLGASFRGDDWMDPYFRSGGGVQFDAPVGALDRVRFALAWEEQESATLELDPVGGADARAIRPITGGTDLRFEAGMEQGLGTWLGSRARLGVYGEMSALADFGYTRWTAVLSTGPTEPDAPWSWEGIASAAVGTGTLPEQRLLLLGGRGTVPGYEFRPFAGDVAVFTNVAVSRSVWQPWLRIRALAAAGWSDLGPPNEPAADRIGAGATGNVITSLGGGLSLFYDLVRLDVARGLNGGDWEWMVSVAPAFRAPL
jgi:hypothetical protein